MKISADIIDVLEQSKADGNLLSLPSDLSRNLYVRVDKVLKDAGGKWKTKLKAHEFDGSAEEALDRMLSTGEVSSRKDFGFFGSTADVASRAVDALLFEPGMKVLEPSAGHGELIKPLIGLTDIDCVELRDENVEVLRKIEGLDNIYHQDFMTMAPQPIYDRVLMNPPFLRYTYIRHILHAFQFLVPGGRLVSVAPAMIKCGNSNPERELRDLIAIHGGEIINLPEKSFKSAGVVLDTVLIVLPK